MNKKDAIKLKLKQWTAMAVLGTTAFLLLGVFFILSMWILAGAAALFLILLLISLLSRVRPHR